jgi:hypothetical protein
LFGKHGFLLGSLALHDLVPDEQSPSGFRNLAGLAPDGSTTTDHATTTLAEVLFRQIR